MLSHLLFKLVFGDEGQEVVREAGEFEWIVHRGCFPRHRQLCLELGDQLEEPSFHEIETFGLNVGSNADVLALLQHVATQIHRQVISLVVVSLEDESFDVGLVCKLVSASVHVARLRGCVIAVPVNPVGLPLEAHRRLLGHVKFADNLGDGRLGEVVLRQVVGKGHIWQVVALEHDCFLFVKLYHVHLAFLTLHAVDLLFVLGKVAHLNLGRLKLAHHLERVCRLCLFLRDDDDKDVRARVCLVVITEDLARLAGSVTVHDNVNVEDTVRLQVLHLVSHDWPVGQGQASHGVPI